MLSDQRERSGKTVTVSKVGHVGEIKRGTTRGTTRTHKHIRGALGAHEATEGLLLSIGFPHFGNQKL